MLQEVPKALAPVGKTVFLEFLLRSFMANGFRRFVLCCGFLGNLIEQYFAKNPLSKAELVFSREEKPLGTAGAVKCAEPLLRSESFLVANGDSFCRIDYEEFFLFHQRVKPLVSIAVTRPPARSDGGSVRVRKDGGVAAFTERKPHPSNYFYAGVGLFEKRALTNIPAYRNFSLEYDFFPMLKAMELRAYRTRGRVYDIGIPERLEEFRRVYPKLHF